MLCCDGQQLNLHASFEARSVDVLVGGVSDFVGERALFFVPWDFASHDLRAESNNLAEKLCCEGHSSAPSLPLLVSCDARAAQVRAFLGPGGGEAIP